MRRRLVRTLLLVATITVVWLLVAPKQAFAFSRGAPVCDPRGATTFAPPPQVQDAELSLDIPADCLDLGALDFRLVKNCDHGRSAPPELTSSQESMTTPGLAVLDFEFSERLPAPSAHAHALPAGVRRALERPPQA